LLKDAQKASFFKGIETLMSICALGTTNRLIYRVKTSPLFSFLGQLYLKAGALPGLAANGNRSTVLLHDRLGNGQPQSRAPLVMGAGSIGPPEPFKYFGQVLRGNANAGILHHDLNVDRIGLGIDRHLAACGRILQRVLNQIGQGTGELILVSPEMQVRRDGSV
jgi:hypothetical protein